MRVSGRLVALGVVLAAACTAAQTPQARFVRQIPWQGTGMWLKADTHVHTLFSDGSETVASVVDKAASFGCDVVAITDHLDTNLKGATDEYFAAIEAARTAHPSMVILAGAEWNIPPWGGDEHAVVLVPPAAERKLAEFKAQFDDLDTGKPDQARRPTHDKATATAALRWLADNATVDGIMPVVLYEHPSRKDAHSIENVADLKFWRATNAVVVGMSGAPGHQGTKPLGSYQYTEKPIDRWDPAAARVGDAWDTLLGQGLDVWAASAPSDFHNDEPSSLNDFWPGQFSETWLYAPARTSQGVLQALRAGSFFADHGRIVREVELRVRAQGLPRPAGAGEVFAAPLGTRITADVSFVVPGEAWTPGPNTIDQVELIAVKGGSASVVASAAPAASGPALTFTMPLPAGGLVLRARGGRTLPDGGRLLFYTNPVRVTVR